MLLIEYILSPNAGFLLRSKRSFSSEHSPRRGIITRKWAVSPTVWHHFAHTRRHSLLPWMQPNILCKISAGGCWLVGNFSIFNNFWEGKKVTERKRILHNKIIPHLQINKIYSFDALLIPSQFHFKNPSADWLIDGF